ncbi:MAG TPA: EAL domain-containing protein [Burkholderiales bacterium]|nr:EAL domain-containing protein [Burkholderiales bacterium]
MPTILIVDDRASNRQFLTTLLGYGGHRLLEASDGAQALELTRTERPQLVITDILMPNMDGFEYVQHIRNDPELARTPVIFYTATYSAPEAHALARSCRVEIVLPKPCEPQEMLAAVNKALGVEAPVAALSAAAKQGIADAGRPDRPDDTTKRYVKDLQAVKLGFDEVIEHSEKLIAQRDLARGLSKKLSTDVGALQRVMSRLSALIEVGMEMTSERDPAKLVRLFFAAACDIVESKFAAVAILDEQEAAFRHVYAKGIEAEIYRTGSNGRSGVLGSMLSGHRPIRGRSLDADADADGFPSGHPPVRNVLAVPVASADRAYGWLYFADKPGAKEFSIEDERLAGIMATKLALLYENLMLYHVVQRHAATLQVEGTDRRRAQDALRESEARLHRAQAMAKLAHVITGPDGSFESWSETLPALIGVEPAQMPGSTREWLKLLHSDDREIFRGKSIEAGATGTRVDVEYRLRRGDGAWVHIRQVIEPIQGTTDTAGRTRWFGTMQDVTGEKRAAEVSERFRLALDNSADMILIIDRSTMRYVDVNASACRLLGYTKEELLGMGPQDILPGSREHFEKSYDELIANPSRAGGMNSYYLCKDGSHLPFESTRHVLRSGDTWLITAVSRDIRARLAAEREISRFRQAMDVSVDSIYLTDPATMRFVYLNDTACRRLGYPRDQLLQMGPQDVFPMDPPQIKSEYDDVIAAGDRGVRQERLFVRSDKSEGWTELHRRALQTNGETVIVTIGRDITERKQAEDRIRRQNRVYAVLSGINTLIVRVSNTDELFREACRIAVEAGGFGLAWIGTLDRKTLQLRSVAWHGIGGEHAPRLKINVGADSPERDTLAAQAIRDALPVISNDVERDPRIRLKNEMLEKGLRSVIVLPLLVSGEVVGTLTLVALEAGFFDEEEVKLLTELSGDIAFAIDHIEKKEKLDHLAFYDQLTGLANRALFLDRVNQSINAAGQVDGKFALAMLDIERLRTINESLGRQAGDALIKLVSERLKIAAGPAGVSRISADHFALLLGTVKGRSEAGRIAADALRKCFDGPFQVNGTELRISAKAGVALFPGDGTEAEVLLRNAEAALRKGKEGGDRITFHAPEMTARIAENLSLENKLRQALEKEEFVLHYQPKVELETRHIVGVEALIRWQSPERGLVPPGLFIPLLEETGLILQVGAWALGRAVLDHGHWLRQGVPAPRIAVNVSAIQLRQRDFVDVVKEAIARGANPTAIDVEITESLLMEDVAGNIKKLKALRELGMKISIDDFGTGYSSLGYLAKLPVNTLKIDRSFIMTMLNNPDTMTLVQTIISLAHSLRLDVVAEGVEQEDQAKMLRLLRCDQMQGYLFSKPVPMEELTPRLRDQS